MVLLGNMRFLALVLALVLAGLALRLGWGLYGPEMFGIETAEAQGECPNPTLIDEIQGAGSQQTPPFETSTDSFRISYETTADIPEAPFFLTVEPAGGELVPTPARVTREGSATGETFANAEPGRYFLDINTTNGMEYTIRIEECGEGGEANPGEGRSGEGTSPPSPSPSPTPSPSPALRPTPPQPPPQPERGTLMEAGGPEDGPAPSLPGGGCPKEFPVEKSGGCYR